MFPFMYHVIVEAGLEESVVQVSLSLFTPFATTLTLPVMFVKRGAAERHEGVFQHNLMNYSYTVRGVLYYIAVLQYEKICLTFFNFKCNTLSAN